MRLIYGLALIAALVAVPEVVQAQQPQQQTQGAPGNRSRSQQRAPRTPGAVILQHKDELNLTAEQVAQIEKIDAELQEKNRPLQQQMRELRGNVSGDQLSDEQRAELRQKTAPINEEIRKNTMAAREQILQVLSPEQQQRAKELWQPARRRQGGSGNPRT